MTETVHRPETIAKMRRAAELRLVLPTDAAVARKMGVCRETVRRWLGRWDRITLRRAASLRRPR